MNIETIEQKTARSSDKLEMAKRYLEQAMSPDTDEKVRLWLLNEAKGLFSEARDLTDEVEKGLSAFRR